MNTIVESLYRSTGAELTESASRTVRSVNPDKVIITQEAGPDAWELFLNKIELETGLKVDAAYRRKYDEWIQLIDEDTGDIYDAEITKYHNGDYEFNSENMNISVN